MSTVVHRGTSLRYLLPRLACILIAVFGSAAASPHPILAETEIDHCTAIGIGRKATANGATMIAHTDDRCDPGGMEKCDPRCVHRCDPGVYGHV